MIGLILIPAFLIWLIISTVLSSKIPDWLGIKRHATVLSLLLFPLVLASPFSDEIVGDMQFRHLCEKEAVIFLSPDWTRVRRASRNDAPITELHGYAIPISVHRVEFIDTDTKQPFLSYKGFQTRGGFLMRNGLGFERRTSCWPKDKTQVLKNINIDQLQNRGETK